MTLKVFEAFSGLGSQRMALRNLGIAHEVVATSDIDEFAVKSYAAIHDSDKVVPEETRENMETYLKNRNIPLNNNGVRKNLKGDKLREFYEACVKSNNLGDISKVDTQDIPDHDLFTYSFPCQDISVAGQGLGLDEGSDTRSGLLWECQKIIAGKKPKYLLLENVKNLVGKRHKPNFDKWLEWLEVQGYTNYWQVLNAKDYGIPQNRERVFVVSILGDHTPYEFPEAIELELRLKDVLESEVDEKFYLDDERVGKLTFRGLESKTNVIATGDSSSYEQSNRVYDVEKESPTIKARDYKDPKRILEPQINQVAQYDTPTRKNSNRFRTYAPDGIAPTVSTMGGGGREPCVALEDCRLDNSEGIPIKNATKKGYVTAYDGDRIDLAYPESKTRRGRVQSGLSQTLDTGDSKGVVEKIGNIYPSGGQNGNVYETKGISPTISSGSTSTKGNGGIGSNNAPKILETVQKDNYVVEGVDVHPFSKKLEFRGYKQKEVSPCLLATDYKAPKTILESQTNSSHAQKDNYVVEPSVLTPKRTEYGKAIRKDYEKGLIKESRHNMTELRPRTDGISNTLTTVLKDNYVAEPQFRIRKLTPLECWRLMGFSDDDFHKAEEVNSNTQLYKQAGNSIVVDVLEGIFKQLLEVAK